MPVTMGKLLPPPALSMSLQSCFICHCLGWGGQPDNASSVLSAVEGFSPATWTPSLRSAAQRRCPASSARPPGPRSGASGAGCRSHPQTRR